MKLAPLERRGLSCRRGVLLAVVGTLVTSACRQEEPPDPTGPALTASTLGSVYLQEGRLPEAETEFRKVVSLIPRAPSGYGYLAQVYLRSGQYQDAEARIRQALERDSTNVQFHLLLARLFELTNRADEARAALEARAGVEPPDPRVLFSFARLASLSPDSAVRRRGEDALRHVVDLAPANPAARLRFAVALVARGESDSALAQLEELQKVESAPSEVATRLFRTAIAALRSSRSADAVAPLDRYQRFVELTPAYQASLRSIDVSGSPVAGFPTLTFSPVLPLEDQQQAVREAIVFRDATAEAALPAIPEALPGPVAVAVGDYDGDGRDDLLLGRHLFHNEGGRFVEVSGSVGLALSADPVAATFGDYDNDGHLDLYLAGTREGHLFQGLASGGFRDVTPAAGLASAGVRRALFVDVDHDGDLDLFLAGDGANQLYRNNLDGTFQPRASELGLAGAGSLGRDAAFGDFDGDGRIDLFVANERGSNELFRNLGQQRFQDVAVVVGLATRGGSTATAIGDYDNDGALDIFVASRDGGEPLLYRNRGDGTFERDQRAVALVRTLRTFAAAAAAWLDYDNDGRLDLVVVGKPTAPDRPGVVLFRNAGGGRFEDRSRSLPANLALGTALATTDFDGDGDLDLLVIGAGGGVRLLRNDGGNANPYVDIQLTALRTGSGKNNRLGIGSRLELRAGDLYQMRVVTDRVTHFGLGTHRSPDGLRVEWPNGVPQVLSPGLAADVKEAEVLKGSCAFAYAWDGAAFQLVTDVMWKSAMGMPLGIMGSATAYAPPGASTEYVRIPGSRLKERNGRFTLQLTEELWETAYVDEVKLLVVDHPDSVDVFVNERFVPPGPTPLKLATISRQRPPVSATDGDGNDVLPALRQKDDRLVSNLTSARYQGITELHDLILDLGEFTAQDSVLLFLNGWIYPSDASINVAVAQSRTISVQAPSLDVRNARGQWQTAIPDLGFPSGKAKTIIADLTGKFPGRDHHVRIRTNMQIYWDQAFVAASASRSPVRVVTLEPVAADLHFRGYSRTFRKGGRYGPHWFDYDVVSTEARWRPIEGRFTRFGEVQPLLQSSDDQYVIMAPGDEATLDFDAAKAPPLPPGWRRDFLLYTDGWIKDSDLNTAFGTTVGPVPFHAMSRYPYGAAEAYPADSAHR